MLIAVRPHAYRCCREHVQAFAAPATMPCVRSTAEGDQNEVQALADATTAINNEPAGAQDLYKASTMRSWASCMPYTRPPLLFQGPITAPSAQHLNHFALSGRKTFQQSHVKTADPTVWGLPLVRLVVHAGGVRSACVHACKPIRLAPV